MLTVKIIYIVITALGVLYFTGLPLARLFLSDEDYSKMAAIVAPAIGLSYIVSFSHVFNYAGLGAKSFIWVMFLLIFFLVPYLVSKKKSFSFSFGEYILPSVFVLVAAALAIYPIIPFGTLSTFGGNSDPVQYFITAEYLQDNPLVHHPFSIVTNELRPNYAHTSVIVDNFYRLGSLYFLSIVGLILNLKTYLLYSILSGIFLGLISFGNYFLSRFALKLDVNTSRFASFLVAINSLIFIIHFDDFYPQIMGLFLLQFSLAFFILMLEEWKPSYIFLAALFLSALACIYTEALYFMVFPAVFYSIFHFFKWRKGFGFYLKTYVLYSVLTIVINPPGFYRAVKSTLVQAKAAASNSTGNLNEFISLADLFGFVSRTPGSIIHGRGFAASYGILSKPYYHSLSIILTVIAGLFMVYGVFAVKGKYRHVLISILAASALMLIATKANGYAYGYFKTLATTVYMASIAVSVGVVMLVRRLDAAEIPFNMFLKAVIYAFAGIYIYINLSATGFLSYGMSRVGFWQTKDIMALEEIDKYIPPEASIFFADDNEWAMYFIKAHRVTLKHFDTYLPQVGFYKNIEDSDYILYTKDKEKSILSSGLWHPVNMLHNSTYSIAERNKGILNVISFEDATGGVLRYRLPLKVKIDKGNVEINGERFEVGDEINRATAVFSLVNLFGAMITAKGATSESFENAVAVRLNKDSPAAFELTSKGDVSKVFLKRLIFLNEGISPDGADKSLTVYGKASNIGGKAVFESFFRNGNPRDFFPGKYPEDLRYSIDIYEKGRLVHPEGHYGYWFVSPLNTEKPQSIRFELDLVKKECAVFINGKAATEVPNWIGPVSDGEFAANFAIWRGDKPLMVEPLFTFKVEGGRLTGFDGKEILKSL